MIRIIKHEAVLTSNDWRRRWGSSSPISSSASGLENRPKDWQRESLGRLFYWPGEEQPSEKRLTHGLPCPSRRFHC